MKKLIVQKRDSLTSRNTNHNEITLYIYPVECVSLQVADRYSVHH